MLLLEEALLISEEEMETMVGRNKLSDLMDRIVDVHNITSMVSKRIHDRTSDISGSMADLLMRIGDFRVLTVTKSQSDGTYFWHLPPTDRSVRLEVDGVG